MFYLPLVVGIKQPLICIKYSQELLIDQITNSVMDNSQSTESGPSGHSTPDILDQLPQDSAPQLHAFNDPLHAFTGIEPVIKSFGYTLCPIKNAFREN